MSWLSVSLLAYVELDGARPRSFRLFSHRRRVVTMVTSYLLTYLLT